MSSRLQRYGAFGEDMAGIKYGAIVRTVMLLSIPSAVMDRTRMKKASIRILPKIFIIDLLKNLAS
jgi:hypothetical protein